MVEPQELPKKTHWLVLLTAGILAVADLAALSFGLSMLLIVHSELNPSGERWGLFAVILFSIYGSPIMVLLLVATILFAFLAKRSIRVACIVLLVLVSVGVLADERAVSCALIKRNSEIQQIRQTLLPFYTSGLHDAVEEGDVKRASEILESWTVPWSESDGEGNTTLHIAAKHGDRSMLEMLFAHRTNDTNNYISYPNTAGRTPLHLAVLSGNIETVRLLLDNGAYFDTKDALHKTPLAYAQELGNEPMAGLLREYAEHQM